MLRVLGITLLCQDDVIETRLFMSLFSDEIAWKYVQGPRNYFVVSIWSSWHEVYMSLVMKLLANMLKHEREGKNKTEIW